MKRTLLCSALVGAPLISSARAAEWYSLNYATFRCEHPHPYPTPAQLITALRLGGTVPDVSVHRDTAGAISYVEVKANFEQGRLAEAFYPGRAACETVRKALVITKQIPDAGELE